MKLSPAARTGEGAGLEGVGWQLVVHAHEHVGSFAAVLVIDFVSTAVVCRWQLPSTAHMWLSTP
jgi:hypothetical protein